MRTEELTFEVNKRLVEENAALKEALKESTTVLESLLDEKSIDNTATHRRYIRIKAAIDRAKLLAGENKTE